MAAPSVLSPLERIEAHLDSRRRLALFRIQLLEKKQEAEETDSDYRICGGGLASLFVPVLQTSVQAFLSRIQTYKDQITTTVNSNQPPLAETTETEHLIRVLSAYCRMADFDATLEEELGRYGAHVCLSRLLKLDPITALSSSSSTEADQETIMEVQDLTCEIVAACAVGSFPRKETPLTPEELRARLPLVFDIPTAVGNDDDDNEGGHPSINNVKSLQILIHQVTARQSAQKDVGFLMWPSAVVLARWLVSHPEVVVTTGGGYKKRNQIILELGAGCGLVGLVAASLIQTSNSEESTRGESLSSDHDRDCENARGEKKNGSDRTAVVLSDFNDMVVKNLHRNILLNGLEDVIKAEALDFYQQDANGHGWLTTDERRMDPVDLVLASDIICQPDDAYAAARTIACALKPGGRAVLVSADSKHRFGVEHFEEACRGQGLIISKTNASDWYKEDSSATTLEGDQDMEKCAGFIQGMSLTMYEVTKQG